MCEQLPEAELAKQPLRIYAPGSLRPLQEAILDGFGNETGNVRAEFAPPAYSGVLAQQITDGAPADVFISANTRYLAELGKAGLVVRSHPLARNRLLLVSRGDLDPPVNDLVDFARSGLRVLVPPPIDPLGEYALEMLARAGLSDALARKQARGEVRVDLASLQSALDSKQVDAAVLYASMVASFPGVRVTNLPRDLDMHERVLFAIGVVERDGRSHPAAGLFVDWLLGEAGQAVLQRGGFLPLR